jgi:hypothetical protein
MPETGMRLTGWMVAEYRRRACKGIALFNIADGSHHQDAARVRATGIAGRTGGGPENVCWISLYRALLNRPYCCRHSVKLRLRCDQVSRQPVGNTSLEGCACSLNRLPQHPLR